MINDSRRWRFLYFGNQEKVFSHGFRYFGIRLGCLTLFLSCFKTQPHVTFSKREIWALRICILILASFSFLSWWLGSVLIFCIPVFELGNLIFIHLFQPLSSRFSLLFLLTKNPFSEQPANGTAGGGQLETLPFVTMTVTIWTVAYESGTLTAAHGCALQLYCSPKHSGTDTTSHEHHGDATASSPILHRPAEKRSPGTYPAPIAVIGAIPLSPHSP